MTVDFNDYFWGDKNNGFDVLYHNMKYGLVASKELSEFFREKSSVEEQNTKLMTKLINKAGSGCVHGTFAPIWLALKSSAERLSALHLQMVNKLTELVKEVTRYADELHKKHKSVKEEEAGTLEAVQAMQASTMAVHKAKEMYTLKMQELEKLKKDTSTPKDLEKAESKVKKQQDDYKNLMEKHNPVKSDFEKKMTNTCRKFQEIEEMHLKQMREFLTTYIELLQNNHDMVGQVHSDFKRQFQEMSVDKLLEQFVLSKYTGLEKPKIAELVLTNWSTTTATSSTNNSNQSTPQLHANNLLNNSIISTSPSTSTVVGSPLATSSPNNSQPPMVAAPTETSKLSFKSWFSSNISSSQNSSVPGVACGGGGGSGNVSVIGVTLNSTGGSPQLMMGNMSAASSPSVGGTSMSAVSHLSQQHQSVAAADSGDGTMSAAGASPGQTTTQSTGQEVAPDTPAATNPSDTQVQTQNIGRNPLRGSKFSGFLRSRREKAKTKKIKKKKDVDNAITTADDKIISDLDEKEDRSRSEAVLITSSIAGSGTAMNQQSIAGSVTMISSHSPISVATAPTATPEVDEDGYSIQPKEPAWENTSSISKLDKTGGGFYSDSDSDSENEEREKKIHVEIKPLNNGSAPISASVDELRATVENLSLTSIGVLAARRGSNSVDADHLSNMKRSQSVSQQIGAKNPPASSDLLGLNFFQQNQQNQGNNAGYPHNYQSPGASNASTPTASHPYAPLQSPTLSVSNNSRYADLCDIFTEIGDISGSAPVSANISKLNSRQIPTPTSTSSIAIPRPPSRRSENAARASGAAAATNSSAGGVHNAGRVSPSAGGTMSRADSVGSLEFRTASIGIGSSRGPSPLTIGMADTIPLAVAFHEIVHAYFKGADESRCQVKMSGDMMLSFPAGIVNVLANNPNPAKLGFRIKNAQNLENILPNKQLVSIDNTQSTVLSQVLEFNMPALSALLRRQSEANPTASYFNVDILKYQIRSKTGAASCPLQLVSYWKCEAKHTDLKIDFKYNSHAMASPSPLLNVAISVPVDGSVRNVQSKPHSAWLGESNRLVWNFTDISQHSDNAGVGTLRARLEIAQGPSTPAVLSSQFNCEGTTLSGIEFELAGPGYRLSLVKRRFVSGKYICEGDGIRASTTPTPPSASSPNTFTRIG